MKVLMQTRQNVFDLAGGDTTQLVKTKEALESKGIDVDLSLDLRPDVSGYDVVHLFNLTRVQETFIQSKTPRRPESLSCSPRFTGRLTASKKAQQTA